MKVYVKLQGTLPDHYQGTYPKAGLEVELNEPITVAELVDILGIPRERVSLVSINGRLAKADAIVPKEAEVKLLQQLSGG